MQKVCHSWEGGGGLVGRVTTIVLNDVIYCFLSDIGGGGPENSNYGSDILSAWPLTIWVSGQTIFGYAFSSWNGALLTPARIGNLAYHNRHPNTYPSLSFESRCTSTGKMGVLVRHLNPNYTYLRIIVDMFKMLKSNAEVQMTKKLLFGSLDYWKMRF